MLVCVVHRTYNVPQVIMHQKFGPHCVLFALLECNVKVKCVTHFLLLNQQSGIFSLFLRYLLSSK